MVNTYLQHVKNKTSYFFIKNVSRECMATVHTCTCNIYVQWSRDPCDKLNDYIVTCIWLYINVYGFIIKSSSQD